MGNFDAMKALDYFAHNIRFDKDSEITGVFDIRKYRFLQRPCESLDDPRIRRATILKASGCMGTVFLQMVLAYDIERTVGDIQVVAQTDDDSKQWTKTRAEVFILTIPGVSRLIKSKASTKSAGNSITSDLWLFTHKFVKISGPGESAQQSKQVHRLRTDESHLAKHFPPGTLAAFEARMGGKWNRHEMHFTTAPDKGAEVDTYYMGGNQGEFCYRCLKCANLVWPLWEDWSRDYYNGERVFVWRDKQSEQMQIDSLRFICPHCQNEFKDETRTRYDLQTDGDYLYMNPGAPRDQVSFRWSCFGAFWMLWADRLKEWNRALASERIGDVSKMEEFEKKRLCMQYVLKLHALGDTVVGRDHKLSEVWIIEEEKRRFGSFDVQAKDGRHYWALCDEYTRSGQSRRVNYCRLENWTQVHAFQQDHGILDCDTGIDVGHAFSEVIAKCAEWHWLGMQSGDSLDYFMHPDGRGGEIPNRWYSANRVEDSLIGKAIPVEIQRARKRRPIKKIGGVNSAVLGPGFALVVQWSKPNVGFILLALKGGASGRYFGVATDMEEKCPDYVKQLHTYVEATKETTTKGLPGFTEKRHLRQLSEMDHAFPTTCQNLILAMRAGFFPMDFTPIIQQDSTR